MTVTVIGDIHTQESKLWRMLREAELADERLAPTDRLTSGDVHLVLLGDLVHAKSREQYARLTSVAAYDEFNPEHLARAEREQERFLRDVKRFADAVPDGRMTILMGNHDYNAVTAEQGPLRTDDISHLEWKDRGGLPPDLRDWVAAWPFEREIEGIHFAHVGPRPEHNRFDHGFYLENRRRWVFEEQDFMKDTPYRLGVYGHTPVRGGVNLASQGRAILLDTNGHGDEYAFLQIDVEPERFRLRLRGLFFDETVVR